MAGWVKFYAFASGDVLGRILTASDTMSGSGDIVVGDRVCCDLTGGGVWGFFCFKILILGKNGSVGGIWIGEVGDMEHC